MGLLYDTLDSWLFKNGSSIRTKWRTARFNEFLNRVKPPSGARIIDFGGNREMWELIDNDFLVTIVNLPGQLQKSSKPSRISVLEADATNLHMLSSKSFDVVYSNSVIEHVGDDSAQSAFAGEVERLADAFWVQTPSDKYPFEVHTRVPYYWSLPNNLRKKLIQKWERELPAWSEMIKGTRVLSEDRMRQLFPGSDIYYERSFGFEKSYSLYKQYNQIKY